MRREVPRELERDVWRSGPSDDTVRREVWERACGAAAGVAAERDGADSGERGERVQDIVLWRHAELLARPTDGPQAGWYARQWQVQQLEASLDAPAAGAGRPTA